MKSFVPRITRPHFLALVAIFLVGGCQAGKVNNPAPPSQPYEMELPFAEGAMDVASYQQEMRRWRASLHKNGGPEKKAEAHLHLAALYLAKDNAQKDYHVAYVELTKATTLWPDLAESRALVSWLALLARFESEGRNAKNDIAALKNELTQAQQEMASQSQELVKLRETLDRLKRLELSVERKRRSFK